MTSKQSITCLYINPAIDGKSTSDIWYIKTRSFQFQRSDYKEKSWVVEQLKSPTVSILRKLKLDKESLLNPQPFVTVKKELQSELKDSELILTWGNLSDTNRWLPEFSKNIQEKMVNVQQFFTFLFPEWGQWDWMEFSNKLYGKYIPDYPDTILSAQTDSLIYLVNQLPLKTSISMIYTECTNGFPAHPFSLALTVGLSSIQGIPALTGFQTSMFASPANTSPASFVKDILNQIKVQPAIPATKKNEKKVLTEQKIETYFEHFSNNSKSQNLSKREHQIQYAKWVAESVEAEHPVVIEAGTGTGKTLGYLIPMMEYARLHPEKRLIISTAMRNLQHQIYWKEVKKINEVFPDIFRDIRVAIVKGKSNYLCLGNLLNRYQQWRQNKGSAAEGLSLLYLFNLSAHTDRLDLESIPETIYYLFPELSYQLEEMRSDIACRKGNCRFHPKCLYDHVITAAFFSNIIIVNHAKMMSLPTQLFEDCALVLVDEADVLPSFIRSSLSVEFSWFDIQKLNYLSMGTNYRSGWLQEVKKNYPLFQPKETQTCLEQLQVSIDQLNNRLAQIFAYKSSVYLPEVGSLQNGFELKQLIFTLQESLEHLASVFKDTDEGKHIQEWMVNNSGFLIFKNHLDFLVETVKEFSKDYPSESHSHYAVKKEKGWLLGKKVINIDKWFQKEMQPQANQWIFTSATITIDGNCDLFYSEIGLFPDEVKLYQIPSPFNYEKQVSLVVPTFMPEPDYQRSFGNQNQWLRLVAETCGYLTSASYGRTLILCTSNEQMEAIFRHIHSQLTLEGILVLKQQGTSQEQMRKFEADDHSVLIGVDRFWTGVDFPGQTLSQLIIVKLPFGHMDDPELKHRLFIQKEYFWNYYRSLAKLKFRQGFGRLIRSEKDEGVVVVLDKRVLQPKHKGFLENIPKVPVYSFEQKEQLRDYISRRLGIAEEFEIRRKENAPNLRLFDE